MNENNAPKHPGKIVFMEGDTITHEKDASEVPFSIRYVETPDGFVPVVKIVANVAGNRRIIRQYGPDDELLESTIQIRDSD